MYDLHMLIRQLTPVIQRRTRVGWAGIQQPYADVAILEPVIEALAEEVDWIFFGMMPVGCERYVREFYPEVPLRDYPAKLARLDLDIALAPLEINPIYEAKSNVRLLEYGRLGWPVIATDILPYRENSPPIIRVSNTPLAWTAAILDFIEAPEAARRLGSRLQQWVKKHDG